MRLRQTTQLSPPPEFHTLQTLLPACSAPRNHLLPLIAFLHLLAAPHATMNTSLPPSHRTTSSCIPQGIMRLRTPDFGGAWVPVFDTASARTDREATSETYWPVGMSEGEITVIVCGEQRPHPSVVPAPVLSTLPLRVPAVPSGISREAGGGSDEAELLRAGVQLSCVRGKQVGYEIKEWVRI